MKKTALISVVLLSFLALSGAAMALEWQGLGSAECLMQGYAHKACPYQMKSAHYGKWWKQKAIAEELSLTDDEKKQLNEMFYEHQKAMIELMNNAAKENLELDYLLDNAKVDEALAIAQFKKLQNAHSLCAAEGFKFMVKTHNLLGAERHAKLKSHFHKGMEDKMKKHHKMEGKKCMEKDMKKCPMMMMDMKKKEGAVSSKSDKDDSVSEDVEAEKPESQESVKEQGKKPGEHIH